MSVKSSRAKYLALSVSKIVQSSLALLGPPEAPQIAKNLPHFYGTGWFSTAFTSTCHLSLSWARLIQSISPQPTSLRSTLKLPSHLWLGLPSGLFPSCFPTIPLHTTFHSPIHATWPTNIIILDLISPATFGEHYRSLSSSLCSFLHCPVASSPLSPNILLSTQLSNTCSLCSSLNVSDQVSHPYETTSKIIVLYFLIFIFLSS